MKKLFFLLLFLLFLSCGSGEKRKPISSDIVEISSPELNLTIPEIENLMQSNITNICVPIGTIDNLFSINILSKVSQNLILKVIIPKDKIILFKDEKFSKDFLKKIESEIVKCISQQIKVNSILFVLEEEKIPESFEYFNKFLKKLKPLSLSIGLGIPEYLLEKFKEKMLTQIDYAVIFSFGFPYPPSLDNSLLVSYRLNTKEKDLINFSIPFYLGLSIANGAWISSNEVLENYIIGMPFNRITESPAFEFLGPNLSATTHSFQFIFTANSDLEFGKFILKRGSNLNIMLFSYDKAKEIIGNQSRFLNPNYIGRYYHYYSTEESDGVLNFNSWISYLKAQITAPIFDLQIDKGPSGYILTLTNVTGLYSNYSREKNYLEWEFKSGYFKEANIGDFSRFRFNYGEEEVMPPQADRIRFYENFIGPFEVIKTGPIKVSGDINGIFRISYFLPGDKQRVEILRFK